MTNLRQPWCLILPAGLLLMPGCTAKPDDEPTGDDSDDSSDVDTAAADGGVVEPVPYVAEELCIHGETACARLDTGQVACWGYGSFDPFLLDLDAVQVRCGYVLCAEEPTGAITCVDREASVSTDYNVPPDDLLPLTDWWLSGWGGGCGVQPDSTSICWPDTRVYSDCAAGRSVRHISFTSPFTIMVSTDGHIESLYKDYDCKYSGEDESGNGYTYGLESPPDGDDFQSVAAGTYHACALDSKGQATCWGRSDENLQPNRDLRFTQLDAAERANCGVTSEGRIDCRAWPSDYMPADVPTGDNWVQVVISTARGCALDTDGQVTCFGDWSSYGSTLQDALHTEAIVPTAKPPFP